MAFYIHLGCELSGSAYSTGLVDQWIHLIGLVERLDIMALVISL